MENFGIIGVGGYIAPRHLESIYATGNRVELACDVSDSVGVLDRYSVNTQFTTDPEDFFRRARHHNDLRTAPPISYISICTPNHLHPAHCEQAMACGAHAISEKPLAIDPRHLDQLERIEERTGRHVYTVLQLRSHDRLLALKRQLDTRGEHDVVMTYITGRGPWYHASWKGDVTKSGGIAVNIGIHLFDLLIWLFGSPISQKLYWSDNTRMAGVLFLQRARVRWYLSVNSDDAKATNLESSAKQVTLRSLDVDGLAVEFSQGFADLHTRVYQSILRGNGLRIGDARPSVELTHLISRLPLSSVDDDAHPLMATISTRGPI